MLMAPAWVLADEGPSFTVDAANPRVVAVLRVCNGSSCADLQEGDSFSGRSLGINPAPPFQLRRWHLDPCFACRDTGITKNNTLHYMF